MNAKGELFITSYAVFGNWSLVENYEGIPKILFFIQISHLLVDIVLVP